MTKPLADLLRKWDQRIERAGELAGQYPFATEVLTFYSKLAAFQKGFSSRLQSALGCSGGLQPGIFRPRPERPPASGAGLKPAATTNGPLSPELNAYNDEVLEALMARFRPFLSFLGREGPSAMACFAARLEKSDPVEWAQLLKRFWRRNERERKEPGGVGQGRAEPVRSEMAEGSSVEDLRRFTALAILQPYAEYLAHRAEMPAPVVRRPVCPFCGSKPLAGVLRPEGEGAKRSLVCSFCYTEWDYLRIACPACEESRDEKMCVYTASKFELVRVEACETCKTYIKTVDLTKNGLAIPEVDELAAIPLTLWADDQGYTKISRNILGS
ncbi:MAG TPA: formate dehydrogenase accessory protein FdhE [Terriglobia bacterium]|nr:formate dehydrogenase accessory protein FdhE [Terriglobia bacterium]